MRRPVVGIIGNFQILGDDYPVQAVGVMNIDAVSQVSGAIPLIIPAMAAEATVAELAGICDGFVFTGARPNVHPSHYGHETTDAHGSFDMDRDNLTLPLIRHCVDAGIPILGICRGFQEFNVAYGGTLHPEIRDLPGRINHRMDPEGDIDKKFEDTHTVTLKYGGVFAEIFGATEVCVNSLHGQGISQPAERAVVEGRADDGTIEAIYIKEAASFSLAVQWHPEFNASQNQVSRPLFEAFGDAMRQNIAKSIDTDAKPQTLVS